MKRYAIAFGVILAVIGGTAIVTHGDDPGPPPSRRRVRYINSTGTIRLAQAQVTTVPDPLENQWTVLAPTGSDNGNFQGFWEIENASVTQVRIKLDDNDDTTVFERTVLQMSLVPGLPAEDHIEINCILLDASAFTVHKCRDRYRKSSGLWEHVP